MDELDLLRDYRPFNRSVYGAATDAALSKDTLRFIAAHLRETNQLMQADGTDGSTSSAALPKTVEEGASDREESAEMVVE